MIVAFTTPAMGHVKPMLPLLNGLVSRGVRVNCFGHVAFEDVIRKTGAEFLPYPEVRYDVDRPDFNLVKMAADLIDASETIYPSVLPKVSDLAPRLILQDFMSLWGSRVGTALGIPRVHTVPSLLFNRTAVRAMGREDGVAKLVSDVARGGLPLLAAMARARLKVTPGEAYGLAWRRLAPPVREIGLNMREIQIGELDRGVPRSFVGPLLQRTAHMGPSGFPPGYALISFGTLSNNSTERFEAALEGAFLAGFPAVLLCGRKVDHARLRARADELQARHPGLWARVVDRVPEIEPVINDAAIVIHHAGTGLTWESAQFRKPALFIPTIADQMVFATQLERLGIGVRLPKDAYFRAGAIAAELGRVRALRPDWAAIEDMQARAGGADEAVRLVLRTVEGRA